ncbi:putative NADP-dependent mannitol dehydrogenase [Hortaea werneckii]|uniref:NADP-dependent mannitol dehydrogenase n=1 Tax=Hortaea werneckii TaxID=91943 RepID=A0A3M7GQM5_HORWE|nr:putative NADP-dependent mannitol dehydrogenase [Hortaea werneckii]KAI6867410.1 putative NADP-dependent mannitol dehydrogenase [Hortaea werneckii]KAI7248218.1 putative NADP-dependent mannitol dehydrogenase [Hortaea werneckii]KAI7351300.1 putative NADP-dependent mannitol dehydrogenase [Hortaea werneckii]KAI7568682.1 putative NADP-dependent mannitol dehydrogenase [Hortaea werneckii]
MSMSFDEATVPRDPRPTPNTPENVFEQLSMKGKVVAITGAADGIGFAAAEAIAEAGGDLALWYRSNDAAIAKGDALAKKHGIRAKAYQVEVSDPEAVEKNVEKVVQDFGKLDVFVANAGMAISKPITEQTVEEYKKQYAVNGMLTLQRFLSPFTWLISSTVDGVFYCAKFSGQVFKKQGFGNLIITSSISAHIVNVPVDQPVYNSTKAAINHLGKSLAREWREFARVNVVSPGFFHTKMGAAPGVVNEATRMTPLARQGHTKEIKGLYLYLASDASSYQTGSDTVIDGGYILP